MGVAVERQALDRYAHTPILVPENGYAEFLRLVRGRKGHFLLESGHHGARWLDLDPLFAEPRRIEPFVTALAEKLAPHQVSAICGPLQGGAFLAQAVARVLDTEFWFTERRAAMASENLYPVRYVLPPALAARVGDQRAAIVDDVMSAGSALGGTLAELQAHGANTVVAGALLVLGSRGADYFASRAVPVVSVFRDTYDTWLPAECPLCAARIPLEPTQGAE